MPRASTLTPPWSDLAQKLGGAGALGGKAYYTPSDHEVRMDGSVTCNECGLTVEESHTSSNPDTGLGSALVRWNRRVN